MQIDFEADFIKFGCSFPSAGEQKATGQGSAILNPTLHVSQTELKEQLSVSVVLVPALGINSVIHKKTVRDLQTK